MTAVHSNALDHSPQIIVQVFCNYGAHIKELQDNVLIEQNKQS